MVIKETKGATMHASREKFTVNPSFLLAYASIAGRVGVGGWGAYRHCDYVHMTMHGLHGYVITTINVTKPALP